MNTDDNMKALEEMLDKAWQLPLSNGKCVVDADAIRDVVEDMRQSMPPELKQARAIVADRNEIIATAKKEAEAIKKAAEEKANAMIAHEEILVQARQQANETLTQAAHKANETVLQANQKAAELKLAANDYIDSLLKRVEETLTKSLNEVRQSRQGYKSFGRG